jgi:hypothetical protein
VPRAMLVFERQADASWLPTTVILATPNRLQGRCLPGSPDRDARLARILTDALPPRINDQTEERGTFEDWISWGTYNLANGMTTWATEIKPEGTVDTLYEREVANVVASLPPPAEAIEPDPVGEASGIELVEITEGVILRIERETDRRLYGVISAPDSGEGPCASRATRRPGPATRGRLLVGLLVQPTLRQRLPHRPRAAVADAGAAPADSGVPPRGADLRRHRPLRTAGRTQRF